MIPNSPFITHPAFASLCLGVYSMMSREEFVSHCTARATYHKARAEEYEAGRPGLLKLMETMRANNATLPDTTTGGKNGYSSSQLEQLDANIKRHTQAVATFEFRAKHAIQSTFLFNDNDLVILEMIRS